MFGSDDRRLVMRQSSILLIGFMGSGKSSIGRRLARRLNCPFTDLDQEIERAAGMKIPQIFEIEGEEKFRGRETQILRDILQNPAVIASGGGLVTRRENRALLRGAAVQGTAIAYLRGSPATLTERIRRQPGKRPLIDGPGEPLDYEATRRRVEELLFARADFIWNVPQLSFQPMTAISIR